MELKVLVDNNTIIDRYYLGEPAVSYLIRDGETKILFDVGYSDIFIKNALHMQESLMDINYVVLSHGHIDHTGGLGPLAKLYFEARIENTPFVDPTIIAHPDTFSYKEYSGMDIGSILDRKKIEKNFTTRLVRKPLWINDTIVFLGQIERSNDFENTEPLGQCEKLDSMVDDYLIEDSAIVYKSAQGLVIITGCSHAGICNIIEYAKKVCGDDRILDVIGGFHLLDPPAKQVEGTMNYFAKERIETMHPCHCTGLKYKIKLAQFTNVIDVGVGLSLQY